MISLAGKTFLPFVNYRFDFLKLIRTLFGKELECALGGNAAMAIIGSWSMYNRHCESSMRWFTGRIQIKVLTTLPFFVSLISGLAGQNFKI